MREIPLIFPQCFGIRDGGNYSESACGLRAEENGDA